MLCQVLVRKGAEVLRLVDVDEDQVPAVLDQIERDGLWVEGTSVSVTAAGWFR